LWTETTLTFSSLYLAAVGLGLMAFPLQFGVGAVPPISAGAGLPCALLAGVLGIGAQLALAHAHDPGALRPV